MIPAIVLGGWLGAGKTTLVNQLLRQAEGRRIAVLVNDFGNLGIDADLIERASGPVLELAGGCVCCSFGADLIGSLRQVCARQPAPEALLIEASGVALPASVARTAALVDGLTIDGIVVLADAETVRERAADRHVGDTVRQQLAEAELLVLNKIDLLDGGALQRLLPWLQTMAPRACVLPATQGQVPLDVVLGIERPAPAATGLAPRPLRRPAPTHERFVDASRVFDGPVDVAALAQALCAADSGVVRAKGWLTDTDGQRRLLQVVGRRAAITPAGGDAAAPGRLAVIGLRGVYDPSLWS